MEAPDPAAELATLGNALLSTEAAIEAAVFVACLGLAWLIVRALAARRGRDAPEQPQRLWFGRHVVDGVLFPVLALLLALVAQRWLQTQLPLAVFRIVVPVLVSLVVIRVTARVLRAAFPNSQAMRMVERSVSWLAWLTVALWLSGALPVLRAEADAVHWTFGGTQVSLGSVIEGTLASLMVILLSLWLSHALEVALLRGATGNLSWRKMAANVLRTMMLFIGLMLALSTAGIDLTALGVLGGALGVGIGFGLQKVAANYVSGFVILAENSVRIGDMVTVDGFEGRITNINTRYTVIRALNGRESLVPNEMLITQRVENASLADRNVLQSTIVQVPYGSDVESVMPQLQATVMAVTRVLHDPSPSVRLTQFAADGLELTIYFWIGDPENGVNNVRSDVNLAILRRLNQLGIDIPFPQRVLHRAQAAREEGA